MFAGEMERTAFEDTFEKILKRQNITLTRLGDKEKSILQEAATQEKRNVTVERFFRKLFSEVWNSRNIVTYFSSLKCRANRSSASQLSICHDENEKMRRKKKEMRKKK